MKRLALLLLVPAVIAACDQQADPVGPGSTALLGKGQSKVTVCHATGNGSYHAIEVAAPAVDAHLGHGDALPGASTAGGSAFLNADCVPFTYQLDVASSYYTALAGGPGGSDFNDPCPGGAVAVGLTGSAGSYYGWAALSQHRIECQVLQGDGTLAGSSLTPAHGNFALTPYSGACPSGSALVLVDGNATTFVAEERGYCSEIALIATVGIPTSTFGPFTGSGVMGSYYNLACAPGDVITGVYGRSGDILDAVGYRCTRLVLRAV